MTPLHRWVLLATLLGRATSVPTYSAKDACVLVCHEGYGPIEDGGLQKFVLQSGGRHEEARSALGLCLTPRSPDDLYARRIFESFGICRALWKLLAQRRGCDCESLTGRPIGPPATDPEENRSWVSKLTEEHSAVLKPLEDFLKKVSELRREKDDAQRMHPDDLRDLFLAMQAVGPQVWEEGWDKIQRQLDDSVRPNSSGGQTSTTAASSSSEEHVDWDMWCMAQCDNGQGGSACNCDIIP